MNRIHKKSSMKKRNQENLVNELHDFILESLHHIGQSLNLMALMEIKNALRANILLVSVAVSVGFLLWMPFAIHHRGLHLSLQGLVH